VVLGVVCNGRDILRGSKPQLLELLPLEDPDGFRKVLLASATMKQNGPVGVYERGFRGPILEAVRHSINPRSKKDLHVMLKAMDTGALTRLQIPFMIGRHKVNNKG